MSSPRVAVIGGGITGSLCSLVLKNRGLTPVIFDMGQRQSGGRVGGGKHPDSGLQFIRASDTRLSTVLSMLESHSILGEWKGRFGFLGSKGGFLPSEVVGTSSIHAVGRDSEETPLQLNGTDEGDFCGFVHNRGKVYVGLPSNADICASIVKECSIEYHGNHMLHSFASAPHPDQWNLLFESSGELNSFSFDAVVLCTHNAGLAADMVDQIVSTIDSETDQVDGTKEPLNAISEHLKKVRKDRIPGCTYSGYFPAKSLSGVLPFDAVSIPGSNIIQYLARDASKPSRQQFLRSDDGAKEDSELWTAVLTAQFTKTYADKPLRPSERAALVKHEVNKELANLLSLYFKGEPSNVPQPTSSEVKFWGNAFNGKGLELQENSLFLQPWSFLVAGDFIRKMTSANQQEGPSTPFEAAALSGLEAGERVAELFK